ncbi:MAG: TetR/AcrR family transcriptional regulator [Chloroflexota bacterium]
MGVNDRKRGRPPEGDDRLSAEMIVETAKAQMLQQGQKLSIRGLARQLTVDAMAIYHYFENKNALLEAVAVNIMEEIYMPDESGTWKVELEKLCVSYVVLLRDHPGLLETLLNMTGSGLQHADVFRGRFEVAIASLELPTDTQQAALDLLVDYLHGFALAIHASAGTNSIEVTRMQAPFALYIRMLRHAANGQQDAP